jgi:hypothetical protein
MYTSKLSAIAIKFRSVAMLSNCGHKDDMIHVAYSNFCSTSISHCVSSDWLSKSKKKKSKANFRSVTIFLFKHFQKSSQGLITYKISGYKRIWVKCALATQILSFLLGLLTLEDETNRLSETSENNYHYSLCNSPEERSSLPLLKKWVVWMSSNGIIFTFRKNKPIQAEIGTDTGESNKF